MWCHVIIHPPIANHSRKKETVRKLICFCPLLNDLKEAPYKTTEASPSAASAFQDKVNIKMDNVRDPLKSRQTS